MTEPKKTTLTPETAAFLKSVLATVTIKADNPDFDALAAAVSKARDELG